MTTTKQYDNLNRLSSISTVTSSDPVARARYQYNDAQLTFHLKGAGGKLALAARLRRKTPPPLMCVAARVGLSKSKGANNKLLLWVKEN